MENAKQASFGRIRAQRWRESLKLASNTSWLEEGNGEEAIESWTQLSTSRLLKRRPVEPPESNKASVVDSSANSLFAGCD